MSSGPVGLDSREYSYSYFAYTVPDENLHFITAQNAWLVTKIQLFASDAGAEIFFGGLAPTITLQPGGCITLEPNGAYRAHMSVSGESALLVVEYWYQASPDGPPTINVNPP